MERVIEIFFDQFLKEIVGEGERRIKLQAFSACLEAIKGVRRLFLLAYFVCFSCFLSALGFFATAFVLFEQWQAGAFSWHEPRLLFSAGIFAFATFMLSLTVREKKWTGAFRLQERIAELEAAQSSGFTESDLVRVINRVLDERLQPQNGTPQETDHAA